jgi:hypothetical protein
MSDVALRSSSELLKRPVSPLLWGAFLAVSWTWVIGMFLPVLLVKDFGGWAWVIFAVPNCIGAAAMGWTMRSAEHSRQFVIRHAIACRVFSLVTIAFHIFFVSWMLPLRLGPWGYAASAVLVQLAFTPLIKTRATLVISVIILLLSTSLAGVLWTRGALQVPAMTPMQPGDFLGLSLVCLLGFLLCPYLDLTFHRARQATTHAGAKVAFGVGFCVMFLSMIVMTLLYTKTLFTTTDISTLLLMIHIGVQAAFTVMAHAASLQQQADSRDDRGNTRSALGAALAIGFTAAVVAHLGVQAGWLYPGITSQGITLGGMTIGELLYRSFMSFYGLVAPAYLLIAFARRQPDVRWWIATLLLAAPFYWIGFMHAAMTWTTVGVAIVICMSLICRIIRTKAAD